MPSERFARADRIGLAGVILGLFGIASFYLWPDKKWIGWVSLGCAAALVILWIALEIRTRASSESSGATVIASMSRTIDTETGENRSEQRRQVSMSPEFREKLMEIVRHDRPLPVSANWRDLAKDFDGLPERIRADWNRNGEGTESWRIAHQKCEGLCKLAGAMLVKSPNIVTELPQSLQSESDPMFRWLSFLKEKNYLSRIQYGVESAETGKEPKIILFGSIENVARVSAVVCIECAAMEI